jgi:tetratricopeptide (TPR) repeat protein
MPLFVIVAAPLTAELLSLLDSTFIKKVCWSAVASIVVVTALIWSPRPALNQLMTWTPYRFGIGLSTDYIPWGLPAFLDRLNFTGPIFNSQTLGGFYSYYGHQKRIPFYDYRLEDYDQNELLKIYKATFTAVAQPSGWKNLIQRYGFQGVLLENGSTTETAGLLPLISSDPSWRLVYLDYAASFWIRADLNQASPAIDNAAVKNLVAGVSNAVQAENLDSFLEQSGLYKETRQELLDLATRRWDSAVLLTNAGIAKMHAGKFDEAEQLFKRLQIIKPDSRVTLATLAQIELIKGNREAAERYLRKALKHYPNDPDLRQNLDAVLNAR